MTLIVANVGIWSVRDALRKIIWRSTQLADLMKAEGAQYHLRFGAARRLLMMWHAYSGLLYIVAENRKEPLTSEESCDLTQYLNVIYINITGTLDNLCWALLHEHAADLLTPLPPARPLPPSKIGLFLDCIIRNDQFVFLANNIQAHSAWHDEVKSRRDPAAHRIPLAVPPQTITPEEALLYQRLFNEYGHATAKLDFEEAEDIMRRLNRIGYFSPVFISDPFKGPIPIYPTVPDDIGHLISLFTAVDDFLVSASGSER